MKRLPTIEEWQELQKNCTWKWSTRKKGMIVKGHNGRSIFLPAAGYRFDTSLYDAGSNGYYWSSSINTDDLYSVWNVRLYSDDVYRRDDSRDHGFSVRLVSEQLQKGFVDLGLPSGLLWAKENESGLFTYDEAMKLFSPDIVEK